MPNPDENRKLTCQAITSKGKQCTAHPVGGGEYCFTHSPDLAGARAAARRRGGENRPRAADPSPFPDSNVTTARGLAVLLAQLIQDTWTLPPSVNRSRTLAYLVSVQKEMIPQANHEAIFDGDKNWAQRQTPQKG